MKVVIFGADGQLGQACQSVFTEVIAYTRAQVDITSEEQVQAAMKGLSEPLVINAAAYTNVEMAEQDVEASFAVNAVGATYLAKATEAVGGVLVHISTDYVFDGERGLYTEEDTPHPINVYGIAKLAGETAVSAFVSRHYIIRTSALFGPNMHAGDDNFVSKRVSQIRQGKSIKMVDDQWTVPTYTQTLAYAICQLFALKAPYGVYHVVNEGGGVTWYEFTKEIGQRIDKGTEVKIEPVSTITSGTAVQRPRHSTLSNKKISALGIRLPDWRDSLDEYLQL